MTSSDMQEPIKAVTVQNTTSGSVVYTNNEGQYQIGVQVGQVLRFSAIGYKAVTRLVSTTASHLDVALVPQPYQMPEFVLRPRYSPYQADSIRRSATYVRALSRGHSNLMSPVSYLAERLNKRSKRLFQFQKDFYYWEDQKFIETRYTPSLVGSLTGLQGDSLAFFMNANPMPYDYARTATELEIKMWIRDKFRSYRADHLKK